MQDKIKFILIGLGIFAVLIIIMFLGLKVKSLERERANLQNDNSLLNQKIESITQENASLQQNITALNQNVEALAAQNADIQSRFDLLTQERDGLVTQVNELKAANEKLAKTPVSSQAVPSTIEDAYLAGILKQKADLEVQIEMLRTNLKNLKAANDQLTLEKNNLSFEINNLSRDTQEVQHTAEYNQKMVDNLTQELAREKTDKLELAKRLKAMKNDNRILRQQLQSLGERKLALEKKVSDMQSKNANLESSLASMELYVKQQLFQMDDLKTQIEDVRESGRQPAGSRSPSSSGLQQSGQRRDAIQLPPIVVRPQAEGPSDAPAIGNQTKIVAIDKDNNFVIINAGQASNLRIGDTFQVVRDGQNIGTISVIQTRERIAACDIKKEATPLRVGDTIRTL